MALFLIACIHNESGYENNFRVTEVASYKTVAQYILISYKSFGKTYQFSFKRGNQL